MKVLVGSGKFIVGIGEAFGLQSMKYLLVINSGHKSIGNGVDGFIKVWLSNKGVKGCLR